MEEVEIRDTEGTACIAFSRRRKFNAAFLVARLEGAFGLRVEAPVVAGLGESLLGALPVFVSGGEGEVETWSAGNVGEFGFALSCRPCSPWLTRFEAELASDTLDPIWVVRVRVDVERERLPGLVEDLRRFFAGHRDAWFPGGLDS